MTRHASGDAVLVTGFPRLLARLVVREALAAYAGARVVLLARAERLEAARAFVASLAAEGARVEVLEGEVTAIDFGLSGPEYLALARRVRVIHHAQRTNEGDPDPARVALVNVQGAEEALELSRAAKRLERLVVYSSTLVSGDHEGVFREEDLSLGQGFISPVDRSLFRVEARLRRVWGEVPITVVRPSIVVGHSLTGEVDFFDGPYLFVLLLLASPADVALPIPAHGDAPLHLVPVDYVARAGVALGRLPEAASRAVHLVDPAPLAARRAFELLARSAGHRLPRGGLPLSLARTLLGTPGVERFARSPRAFLARLSTRVEYPSQGARALLGPAGIECPPFERYAEALVAYTRSRLGGGRGVKAEPEALDDPLW